MNKLMLAVVFTVLSLGSLASVAAQVNSVAVSNRAKELMADGSLGVSRERVLKNKRPSENAGVAPSLNHSATRSITPDNSIDASATKTRLRTSAATTMAAAPSVLALNQIYRVGVGDVLDVQLLDVPTAKSTLFTVLDGGMLDYPLSNAPVPVAGLTADEIAEQLRARIKVLDNPKVAVKVRDYSSHSVIVTGFVLDPGARFLRREATPLYVVLAEARPRPEAVKATIARNGNPLINIELKDQNSVATLVMPGDVIKVLAPPAEAKVFFYAGGALNSPGQKAFHDGITLTQAILASGGVTRTAGNKVKVSRQGADGRLASTEYNLRQIEEGKSPDPVLQPGDRLAVAETR
jgi:protein involved in polysaccharide export with SLBB domain